MKLTEFCRDDLVCVTPETTLQQAASLMEDQGVGCLIVMDGTEHRKPIGLVTDRDLVSKGVALDLKMSSATVREVMSKDLVRAAVEEDVLTAVKLMEERRVRRLLIVNQLGEVEGIVTSDDLVRAVSDELASIGRIYAEQSRHAQRNRARDFTRMA